MSTSQPPEDNQDSANEPLPDELQQRLEGLVIASSMGPDGLEILTTPERIIEVLTVLAHQLDRPYDMLIDMCGIDSGDDLQVVYRLCRCSSAETAVVKVTVPRSAPRVPTATGLWQLAHWAEREISDMFGITFEGHPDPRPLLLPDDFVGFPLRKDFEYREEQPYLKRDSMREDLASAFERPAAEAEAETTP